MLRLLVLGAVQGLTEFLPISSSGHLVLVPFLLGWPIPDIGFDVAVHLGTALAVIVYFHRDLAAIVVGTTRFLAGRRDEESRGRARLGLLIAVGTVPAGVAGLLFEGFFEGLFEEPQIAALFLLVTAGLLLLGERLSRRQEHGRSLREMGITDALTVGLLQAVAIAPGISRSGAAIVGGLGRGLSRDSSARFAFLLGLPAFIGAGIVQVPELPETIDLPSLVGASALATAVGLLAIGTMLRWIRTRSLRPFAGYAALMAAVSLAYWVQVG